VKDQSQAVVLITGASKRIGAALSRHFHRLNYQVVIHYRNGVRAAAELENELNQARENSAFKVQADLTSREGINKVAVFASQLEHRLTLVIHNAAIFRRRRSPKRQEKPGISCLKPTLRPLIFSPRRYSPVSITKPASSFSVICSARYPSNTTALTQHPKPGSL